MDHFFKWEITGPASAEEVEARTSNAARGTAPWHRAGRPLDWR
jgi:hypothetical protein